MGWREREGREGEGLRHSRAELWVACLTWEHVTFFVREMVTRYFITQYMGYSFRYRHKTQADYVRWRATLSSLTMVNHE